MRAILSVLCLGVAPGNVKSTMQLWNETLYMPSLCSLTLKHSLFD